MLATLGTLYSYTCLQEVPEGFEAQSPYFLALVELDEWRPDHRAAHGC